MPEYLAPGVYVEETSFRPKSIEGVSTSTCAFVGPTRRGPISGTPEIVTSFGEFERMYGGRANLSFASQNDANPNDTNYMAHAVRGFFDNGGRRLYIGRTFIPRTNAAGAVTSDGIASATIVDDGTNLARFLAREQQSGGRPLPWETAGVPLAVAYINQDGAVTMVDRFAVVRRGAAPRTFNSAVAGAGTPFLWQARIQALSAHIRDLEDQGQTIDEAIRYFRYLPPVGFLPKAVVDLESFSTRFFRSHYDLQAVPLPLEQLEVALEASAAAHPYDFLVPDQIKILVPVPQALYEPGLLKQELIDPVFAVTITDLMSELDKELGRRKELRQTGIVVTTSIDPVLNPAYPEPDPESVPGETPTSTSAGNGSGDEVEKPHDEQAVDAVQKLYDWLNTKTPLSDTERARMEPWSFSWAQPLAGRYRFL
ncbi:MAG: hypothetical protein GY850_05660 [bacterium]|nr:hypothetical protein [bacterium]